jgi:hypothetical protein
MFGLVLKYASPILLLIFLATIIVGHFFSLDACSKLHRFTTRPALGSNRICLQPYQMHVRPVHFLARRILKPNFGHSYTAWRCNSHRQN